MFQRLRKKGAVLSQHTYAQLMHEWSKRGNQLQVRTIWDMLVEDGHTPDAYSYAALLDVYSRYMCVRVCVVCGCDTRLWRRCYLRMHAFRDAPARRWNASSPAV